MVVQLEKRTDGGAVLRCIRSDGSSTWVRHSGPQARFFPLHDLTHHAVETVLGARHGFFGLIAAGWDVADTSGKGARGPLPAEALHVERLVGMLDVERASGARWSAEDLSEQLAAASPEAAPAPIAVTEATLLAIRERRGELFARWAALAPGGTLELPFDGDPAPA